MKLIAIALALLVLLLAAYGLRQPPTKRDDLDDCL